MGKKAKVKSSERIAELPKGATAAASLFAAIVYYFSDPKPQVFYDYTFRVAGNFLNGKIAFIIPQPPWLNEFVPFEGYFYSVFPLGAVVSMLPFAFMRKIGMISEMPGAFIAAALAGASCWLLLKIASRYDVENRKRVIYALAILFGTFAWTNLTFDGAWQLALGFAMLGEIGAIYFAVYDRRPFIAGIFFALAFGNRTEVLLTAPVFFYLLWREERRVQTGDNEHADAALIDRRRLLNIARFCVIPFVLGVLTLCYNYVRFHSLADFGYARIPGVLEEPWYNHGIFSPYYIPRQAWEMLLKLWEIKDTFPYLIPNGFSSSILFSSPFLFLLFRLGKRDNVLKYASWAALSVLTLVLWMHGNSGGWQFGYRYAMVLLPWVFVILLETAPKRLSVVEWALFALSFIANAYATWLFHWTEYVKP